MNSESLCLAIKYRNHPGYACKPAPNSRVHITTTILYPNRTLVHLFVTLRPDDRFEITDEGRTIEQIEKYTRGETISYRQQTAIAGICGEYHLTSPKTVSPAPRQPAMISAKQ